MITQETELCISGCVEDFQQIFPMERIYESKHKELSREDWSHMDTVAVLTHPNLPNYSL